MTPSPLPRKSCSKSSIAEGSDALVQVPSIRNSFLAHLYHPASNGMELATFPPDSALPPHPCTQTSCNKPARLSVEILDDPFPLMGAPPFGLNIECEEQLCFLSYCETEVRTVGAVE